MKHTAKLLASIIVCSLLLTACSSSDTQTDTTSTADQQPDETTVITETLNSFGDNLPEGLDYDGYNFRVLTWSDGNTIGDNWNAFIDVEEEIGDVLNDAAYARNLEVMERLNIDISCIAEGSNEGTRGILQQSVLADSDDYDYAVFHPSAGSMIGLIQEGCLLDAYQLEYVDLNQPYYNQACAETFTLNGKLYFIAGDYSATMTGGTQVFYNAELWEDFNFDDPYQIVADNKWTFDNMFSIVKDTYRDENGNGARDADDFYGITGFPTTLTYCYRSCGGETVRITPEGVEFPILSSRSVSIIEKLVSAMSDPNAYFDYEKSNEYRANFLAGKSIIILSGSAIVSARTHDFFTGVLPFPKYDEAQEDYPSILVGGLTAVPATARNTERTGAIIEAFFSASARGFTDAYYQQYVDNKVLQDAGSLEMFKLIRSQAKYDFTSYLDPTGGVIEVNQLVTNCLLKRSTDIASEWAAVENSVEQAFEDLFAGLE